MARVTIVGLAAVLSAALALGSAAAQQDRTGRSDRSSGRDDSAQSNDQSTQQSSQSSNQSDQRRRYDNQTDRANQDRTYQDRDQRRSQQDPSDRSQYSDRSQRGQSSDRSANSDRQSDRSRDQSRDERDQSGRTSLRQRLGLQFNQQQGQNGLSVSDVQQGTAAANAGLRSGDQIVSIDGRQINSQQQFFAYLSGQSGRQVPIVVNRGGRQYTIPLAPDQGSGDVAWLGVFLHDSEGNQEGAQVTQVYPAGPAARAGLRPGDVITAVDGQRVSSSADLISTIEVQQPGAQSQLTIARNNQQVNVPVTLGSRESFTWRGQSEDRWGGGGWGGQSGQWSDQSRGSSQYTSGQSGSQGGQYGSSGQQQDHFANLPPFAMQLEHERRMYEQHQRIETEITKLQEEVRQLRELIQQQQRR